MAVDDPEPLHRRLGVTDDELVAIRERLGGREPNDLELAMFSVMWSEHCSYKSSRPLLRTLPTGTAEAASSPGRARTPASSRSATGSRSRSRSSRTTIRAPSSRTRAPRPASAASSATSSRWAPGRSPSWTRSGSATRPIRGRGTSSTGVVRGRRRLRQLRRRPDGRRRARLRSVVRGQPARQRAWRSASLEERHLTLAAAPGVGNLAVLFGRRPGATGSAERSVLASADVRRRGRLEAPVGPGRRSIRGEAPDRGVARADPRPAGRRDEHHGRDSRRVRRRDGDSVQAAAAALPRARPDQRRSHRPAHRIARRRPHRQGVHRREARGAGLREGRAPPVPQRRPVAHRRLGRRPPSRRWSSASIGIAMMLIGGNAIRNGTMTLGDFVMYLSSRR